MEIFNSLAAASAAEGAHGVWWTPLFYLSLTALIILSFGVTAVRGARENVPRSLLTRLLEHVYFFIENMCVSVIGEKGRRFIPLVFTVYIVILVANFLGVIGLMAPTSVFSVTFGMAVMVVFYVQYVGIRTLGIWGYIRHFFGPPLGWLFIVNVLLFVVEIVSELFKNVSLSLRLYINMSAEHSLKAAFRKIIEIGDFGVPLDAVLVPLTVLVSIVQALVFAVLTCVYLSLFVSHEEEAHAH